MTYMEEPVGEECPICHRQNVWLMMNVKRQWMCGKCAKKWVAEQKVKQ